MWCMLTIVIYLVTAFASIVYAYRKLKRPGISAEVRNLVFKRHVIQIMVFIFSYMYFFVSATIDWWKFGSEQMNINSKILSVLKVNFAMQGIYLPLSRIAEPAFFKLIKKKVRDMTLKFIFRNEEEMTDTQKICVESLIHRGIGSEKKQQEE